MICEFLVPMREFRAALISVLPHVEREKDGIAELKALRVDVGEDALIVSATDRRTAAVSTCKVNDFHSDLPQVVGIDDMERAMRPFESFRLDAEQARHLADLFVAGTKEDEWTLSVQVHEKKLIVTDVSGIVPGETLTTPMTPIDARFPPIARVIQGVAMAGLGAIADDVAAAPAAGLWEKAAARFLTAARTWGQPIDVFPLSRGRILIRVGEAFLGWSMTSSGTQQPGGLRPHEWRSSVLSSWVDRIDHLTPIPTGERVAADGSVDLDALTPDPKPQTYEKKDDKP